MNIKKHYGYLLTKSIIHHGGNEKTGSTPVLRSIFLYNEEKGELQIPYINGNSIRGKLRRLLMHDFLTSLNVSIDTMNIKLYHTFFTGGVLESNDDTAGKIDLELRKQIRNLLPPLALMGCAIGNQMIQGKLKCGHIFPFCSEYKDFLPENFQNDNRCNLSVRSFTDETFITRRDDLKAERKDDEQAQQMKVDYECFIPGTKFFHWWAVENPSEIEYSCFGRMIELFRQSPYLGGSSAIGNGEVSFVYEPEIVNSQTYMNFINTKSVEINDFISSLGKIL